MTQRGAAERKIPHSRVTEGEILYFMEKGTAQISAMATVTSVLNYVKLTEEEINKAFDDNADKLNLTDKQRTRWHKKCLCFVEFSDVAKIDPPLEFDHQGNMDDWLIIEKIEDVSKIFVILFLSLFEFDNYIPPVKCFEIILTHKL